MINRFYAYCVYPHDFERNARGFVLAPNKGEAMVKARLQVNRERNRIARWLNMKPGDLPTLARTYRVRVWLDPQRITSPTAKHYTETASTA